MILVKKLSDSASLPDLMINGVYLAEIKNNTAILSAKLKSPFTSSDGVFPVRITKIAGTSFSVEKVDEPYTVEVEKPISPNYLIDNPAVHALYDDFKEALRLIKNALDYSDLIVLRHHADTDGYCGALCLEEAIVPFVQEKQEKVWRGFKRFPTKIPYYDYADALKDLEQVQEQVGMRRKPLLIVVDNGSGEEDLLSLKRLKQAGARIIVIDHHPPFAEVDDVVDVHVNPWRKGLDGNLTAGMLCAELAHLLQPRLRKSYLHLAALSGVADRSSLKDYLKKQPLSPEELRKIGYCTNFEAHTLKFSDSDSIKDVIFGKPEVIELLSAELEKRTKTIMLVAEKYMQSRKVMLEDTEATVVMLDLEKTQLQDYPGSKILSIALDTISGPRIGIGYHSDLITVRADGVPFSFVKMMEYLRDTLPYAAISGGGHANAGTIHFVAAAKDDVLREIRKYVRLS